MLMARMDSPHTLGTSYILTLWDDVKLAQLVKARNIQSRGRRLKLQKPRTQIYMDLRYIDPQARVLNYCFK